MKKKKPKLFNKFDKSIKAEIDAAEKLRKKVQTSGSHHPLVLSRNTTFTNVDLFLLQGNVEEALKAFELLVQQYPHSPRARYGKAQVKWLW